MIAHIHSTLPLLQFLRRESYPTQERRVTSVSPIPRDCIVMMRQNPRNPSLGHVSPFRLLLIHSSPNRVSLNITLLSHGIVLHQHKQHLHNPREFTQTTLPNLQSFSTQDRCSLTKRLRKTLTTSPEKLQCCTLHIEPTISAPAADFPLHLPIRRRR